PSPRSAALVSCDASGVLYGRWDTLFDTTAAQRALTGPPLSPRLRAPRRGGSRLFARGGHPMAHLFIVQRHRRELFQYVRAHFADEPDVMVWLDRREVNRRQHERRRRPFPRSADRRTGGDRRGPVPMIWTALGYLLAVGAEDAVVLV